MTDHAQTGLTRDAGWQIGVSRTVDADLDEVWRLLTSPAGLALWLGPGARVSAQVGAPLHTDDGAHGETRSWREHDRIRVRYCPPGRHDDTVVQVALRPAGAGRTSVRFHQERLADAAEREAQRRHWTARLDALEAALTS